MTERLSVPISSSTLVVAHSGVHCNTTNHWPRLLPLIVLFTGLLHVLRKEACVLTSALGAQSKLHDTIRRLFSTPDNCLGTIRRQAATWHSSIRPSACHSRRPFVRLHNAEVSCSGFSKYRQRNILSKTRLAYTAQRTQAEFSRRRSVICVRCALTIGVLDKIVFD